MPDKYVPREVGEVHAAQWNPDNPEEVWKMFDWIFRAGLRFSLGCEDECVFLELRPREDSKFAGGRDLLTVFPGEYLVARSWVFEVKGSSEFNKTFRKESDV